MNQLRQFTEGCEDCDPGDKITWAVSSSIGIQSSCGSPAGSSSIGCDWPVPIFSLPMTSQSYSCIDDKRERLHAGAGQSCIHLWQMSQLAEHQLAVTAAPATPQHGAAAHPAPALASHKHLDLQLRKVTLRRASSIPNASQ
jgi:hypothetical protein